MDIFPHAWAPSTAHARLNCRETGAGGLVNYKHKMDVANRTQARQPLVKDELGERVQKLFQDFLESYAKKQIITSTPSSSSSSRCTENGELKYLPAAAEFQRMERYTLTVSFQDVEEHSTRLAAVIQEHYYR